MDALQENPPIAVAVALLVQRVYIAYVQLHQCIQPTQLRSAHGLSSVSLHSASTSFDGAKETTPTLLLRSFVADRKSGAGQDYVLQPSPASPLSIAAQ